MEKLVLFLILLIIILSPSNTFAQFEQSGIKVTCEEASIILKSKECPFWAAEKTNIWCYQEEFKGGTLDDATAYIRSVRSRTPDYILEKDFDQCAWPQTDQDIDNEESSQKELGQQTGTVKQNLSKEDGNLFNLFGVNPFETWLNLKELAEVTSYITSDTIIKDATYLISPGERARQRKEEEYNQMMEEVKFIQEASGRFNQLSLKERIKAGEIMEKFDGRVEAKTQQVIIRHNSSLLNLHPQNGQTGVLDKKDYWPMLKSGALDVIFEPKDGEQFQIQTPNIDLFVIGTEFSVIYDTKKDQTLVAVYKGQVEIKTKDGLKTTISPMGDQPGIVLVAQKLSVTKLAVAGLILTALVVGIVFLLKKRKKK